MAQALTGSGFLPPARFSPQNAADYEAQRIRWYNETEGSLSGYDCPVCRNKGDIAYLKDGYEMHQECECMRKRRALGNIRRSGLSGQLSRQKFGNYQCSEPWQAQAKEKAQRYCQTEGAPWFYIAGPSGAGKTHLCTAICSELLKQGRQVVYSRWADVYPQMQSFQKHDDCIRQLAEAPVLYLDDFLKIGVPEKKREYAFEIIDERYSRSKATILSSETSLAALSRLDEATAGRIVERCGGGAFCVDIRQGSGRNYRLK